MGDRQLPSSEILEIAEETARQVGRSPELVYFLNLFYRRLFGRSMVPVPGPLSIEALALADANVWVQLFVDLVTRPKLREEQWSFLYNDDAHPRLSPPSASDFKKLSADWKRQWMFHPPIELIPVEMAPRRRKGDVRIVGGAIVVEGKIIERNQPEPQILFVDHSVKAGEVELDEVFLTGIERQTDELLEKIEASNRQIEKALPERKLFKRRWTIFLSQ